jgi:hypothetical protein
MKQQIGHKGSDISNTSTKRTDSSLPPVAHIQVTFSDFFLSLLEIFIV